MLTNKAPSTCHISVGRVSKKILTAESGSTSTDTLLFLKEKAGKLGIRSNRTTCGPANLIRNLSLTR